MRNGGSSMFGVVGGWTAGGFFVNSSALGVLAVSAPTGIAVLAAAPFLVGFLPTMRIAGQIDTQYENNKMKLFSAQFLLASSYVVLSYVLHLVIMSAFIASLNPFTLPLMIAAGASASIILGLYLLTRPTPGRIKYSMDDEGMMTPVDTPDGDNYDSDDDKSPVRLASRSYLTSN